MEVMQQIMAVGLVLALLGGTLWWLRRRGFAGLALARRSGERRMECLERLPLGPQHTLLLVRVGETELLMASSPSGCSQLLWGSQSWLQPPFRRRSTSRTRPGRSRLKAGRSHDWLPHREVR